jgi:hypothetical protein
VDLGFGPLIRMSVLVPCAVFQDCLSEKLGVLIESPAVFFISGDDRQNSLDKPGFW